MNQKQLTAVFDDIGRVKIIEAEGEVFDSVQNAVEFLSLLSPIDRQKMIDKYRRMYEPEFVSKVVYEFNKRFGIVIYAA